MSDENSDSCNDASRAKKGEKAEIKETNGSILPVNGLRMSRRKTETAVGFHRSNTAITVTVSGEEYFIIQRPGRQPAPSAA